MTTPDAILLAVPGVLPKRRRGEDRRTIDADGNGSPNRHRKIYLTRITRIMPMTGRCGDGLPVQRLHSWTGIKPSLQAGRALVTPDRGSDLIDASWRPLPARRTPEIVSPGLTASDQTVRRSVMGRSAGVSGFAHSLRVPRWRSNAVTASAGRGRPNR
jgi:hypothetical protein